MIRTLTSIGLALGLVFSLAACGNDMRAGTTPPQSLAQQRLTELRTAYLGANLAIAAYALLPACGETKAPCADLNVLAQVRTASKLLGIALATYQAAISTPDEATTLERVNAALEALTRMLVDYRLK